MHIFIDVLANGDGKRGDRKRRNVVLYCNLPSGVQIMHIFIGALAARDREGM